MNERRDAVEGALFDAERIQGRLGRAAVRPLMSRGIAKRVMRRLVYRYLEAQTEPLRAVTRELIGAIRAERLARLGDHADTLAAIGLLKQDQRVGPVSPGGAVTPGQISSFFAREAYAERIESAIEQSVTEIACDVGDLLISARDEAILYYLRRDGTWEPSEGAVIDGVVTPGMTAVDIGAHVGYRTLQMAKAVGPTGQIIAVEAAPTNFRLLAANIARHRVENAFLIQAAAGETNGKAELSISEHNTGDNRLFNRQGESTVCVEMVRLDDVIPEDVHVGFVKCDVQGYDQRALRGMESTLRRCRPVVVVEFCPRDIRDAGDDPVAALDFYAALGYGVEVIDLMSEPTPASALDLVAAAEAAEHAYVNLKLSPRN